jgi:fructose-1-phosphate kinase PfkB-like protein
LAHRQIGENNMNKIRIQAYGRDKVILDNDTKRIRIETTLKNGLDQIEVDFKNIELESNEFEKLFKKYSEIQEAVSCVVALGIIGEVQPLIKEEVTTHILDNDMIGFINSFDMGLR